MAEQLEHARDVSLRVNPMRLWASLMEMAEVGAIAGDGCKRLAGSDEDRIGRDLFVDWCTEAGLTVTVDRLGNIFGRREGRDPDAAPVLVGSHLDTQPAGGRFDGVLGVLGGLEVVRTLNDGAVSTERPITIVSWTNEEGARFAPAMLASGVFAGSFDLEYGLSRTDVAGLTLGDELLRIGYAGREPCGGWTPSSYLELHIEQGPILEASGHDIGVVTGVQGIRWYDVIVPGQEAHAGSTPMNRRNDALVAAAAMVGRIDRLARDTDDNARSTVGVLTPEPASRNTIAGKVTFTVDLRHPNVEVLGRMDVALRALVREIRAEATVTEIWHSPPIEFDPGCVDAVRRAAQLCGYTHGEVVSGAGHDACYLDSICPTAMVFIPCLDGLSHNTAEYSSPQWCEAGANTLLQAVLERAG